MIWLDYPDADLIPTEISPSQNPTFRYRSNGFHILPQLFIDGLRNSDPVKQQEILAKLGPEFLFTALTSSDAQIREEFIVAITLFIPWRQGTWEFFYQPPVFAQIASFFVASDCRLKVLCLKFCHALVLIDTVAALDLFPLHARTAGELYQFFHGEERDSEAAGFWDEVTRETRPFPWDVMDECYLLQWICDLTYLGGEPAAYSLDTVLLILHADTQVLAGNSADGESWKRDFIAQLETREDFVRNLSEIAEMEDQTYALADGLRIVVLPECAQAITDILAGTPS
jgi:hypothetical protein